MKILHFVYGLNLGGAESFIKNLLISFVNDGYDFEFVLQNQNITNEYFKDLYRQYKDTKFKFIPKFPKNSIAQYLTFSKIIKHNNYDMVHVHMNSFVNPIPIIVCHINKIPVIVHSHNTNNASGGNLGKFLHYINRTFFNYKQNIRIACGTEAGKWMFNNKTYRVIPNAIAIKSFLFNNEIRNNIRISLGIESDTHVIGIVGRLHPQKNHIRAINIFKEYHTIYPNSKLLIIGDGSLRTQLEDYVFKQIPNYPSVIFLGAKQNVAPLYSAMDTLLFPSIYEGLGIVGIEAQAAGLSIVASDAIPQEMDISGHVSFLSLKKPDSYWVNELYHAITESTTNKRNKQGELVQKSNYSLEKLAETMRQQYKI